MAKLSSPHHGSLQFWPRKRAAKQIPSANWKFVKATDKTPSLLGFISYKVGMATAIVKDNTEHSMTKGKKITTPVTILEVPGMKILSVRFYKFGKVAKEVLVSNESFLKRKMKVSKSLPEFDSSIPKEYDDIRVICYSLANQTSLKKTPDIIEIGINAEDKLTFVKSLIGKEISLKDFGHFDLFDSRGLTIGKGLVGPVKRFGITLKQHKTEKGVRRPGSLGPWHPARVAFVTPMAGQLGCFSRVHYNLKALHSGKISEKNINPPAGFKSYGKINSSYIILKGSVQGPAKKQIFLTVASRPKKSSTKIKYEFQEIVI